MDFGLTLPHYGPGASPARILDAARNCEAAGFQSVWVVDHIALPRVSESRYDLGRRPTAIPEGNLRASLSPLYECLTVLSYVAGATERISLGTGVLVLPLRNPVYNARQIATLDALSGGRLILGVGAGWLREEADALQMAWEQRGARMEEHIQVLRSIWQSRRPYTSFHGRFFRFEEIDPSPHPVRRRIPILIGGHSTEARNRAGRIGDGWISHGLPLEAQLRGMEDVRVAAEKAGRDPTQLWFSASVRVELSQEGHLLSPGLLSRVEALHDAGVTISSSPSINIQRQPRFRQSSGWLTTWCSHLARERRECTRNRQSFTPRRMLKPESLERSIRTA